MAYLLNVYDKTMEKNSIFFKYFLHCRRFTRYFVSYFFVWLFFMFFYSSLFSSLSSHIIYYRFKNFFVPFLLPPHKSLPLHKKEIFKPCSSRHKFSSTQFSNDTNEKRIFQQLKVILSVCAWDVTQYLQLINL